MNKLTSFVEAIAIIKANTLTMQTEIIPLEESIDRILAEDAIAAIANPAFNNSAVDGIGITKQTLNNLQKNNTPLKIKKTILAGDILDNTSLLENECYHIMTGSPVPPSISTIFLIEDTATVGEEVFINAPLADNQNIRVKGEDFKAGETLVKKFTRLKFNHISLLAASGIANVSVFKKPRAAFFTSGKETVEVGQKLLDGQIYNSNILTMRVFLENLGFEAFVLKNVSDSIEELQENIAEAQSLGVDIIISSGAVSMGVEDIIKHYLLKNTRVLYNGLKIRPGKPNMLALLENNMLYFALPGNPVSTAAALYFLVQAYYNFANEISFDGSMAHIDSDYNKKKDFTFFLRGKSYLENSRLKVKILEKQGSHILSSLAEANCFVRVSETDNYILKNSLCEIYEIK
ncbi:MAG: molybdopterin molybdotransferase MoeA [Alphaproteobacteria bacterium]|nr:molybdopterin molybdotransferase MoeA [Alphaproteobacteria bacterium]